TPTVVSPPSTTWPTRTNFRPSPTAPLTTSERSERRHRMPPPGASRLTSAAMAPEDGLKRRRTCSGFCRRRGPARSSVADAAGGSRGALVHAPLPVQRRLARHAYGGLLAGTHRDGARDADVDRGVEAGDGNGHPGVVAVEADVGDGAADRALGAGVGQAELFGAQDHRAGAAAVGGLGQGDRADGGGGGGGAGADGAGEEYGVADEAGDPGVGGVPVELLRCVALGDAALPDDGDEVRGG